MVLNIDFYIHYLMACSWFLRNHMVFVFVFYFPAKIDDGRN